MWTRNFFFQGRRKTEKEEEENIWRMKYLFQGTSKQRRKRWKIFGEGKYILQRRRKLEEENIWRRKNYYHQMPRLRRKCFRGIFLCSKLCICCFQILHFVPLHNICFVSLYQSSYHLMPSKMGDLQLFQQLTPSSVLCISFDHSYFINLATNTFV